MKTRWRLRPLVVLAAIFVAAVGLFSTYILTRGFLRTRLGNLLLPSQLDALLNEFATAFAIFSVISILITALLALALAGTVVQMLVRMRGNIEARARRRATGLYRPPIFELHALASALDRLASEFDGREAMLAGERAELALLIGSVSEGILLVGPDGLIIRANAAARTLLGLPDDCRGKPLRSMIRNQQLRIAAEQLQPGLPPLTTELAMDDRRILLSNRPLQAQGADVGPDADRPGSIITLVDLTELRRLEGVRRDFVANVSHELKTPLTSIRGYVETLLSDDLDTPTQRQFLEVIQKNAARLHGIVDDLLDLSRLESGGWRPSLEDVPTTGLINEAWEACADRAFERGVLFVPPSVEANVHADRSALRQILSNLFDNALRYTPTGGSITIRVHTEAGSASGGANSLEPAAGPGYDTGHECVAIDVIDNGSGIPSDDLPRIFERFYRSDPARSRAEGGTGLGLSIVKHLVESMGGSVTAASEIGNGTTIRIRLPARAATVA